MFEKVNPNHPDKIADRIGGALVDLCYEKEERPKCAFEVLIGHGCCFITGETSVDLNKKEVEQVVQRCLADDSMVQIRKNIFYEVVKQDVILEKNQSEKVRCGDNGIFKGVPTTAEQNKLSRLAKELYEKYPTDGKFIIDEKNKKLVICQSNANSKTLKEQLQKDYKDYEIIVNPLGEWTGGLLVDAGATNRKLGSDMADSITGGGLHGKDLSKADVSVNIYAWLKAQLTGEVVELSCAIGDEYIDGKPYADVVEIARNYIKEVGGYEAFAKWGLV